MPEVNDDKAKTERLIAALRDLKATSSVANVPITVVTNRFEDSHTVDRIVVSVPKHIFPKIK